MSDLLPVLNFLQAQLFTSFGSGYLVGLVLLIFMTGIMFVYSTSLSLIFVAFNAVVLALSIAQIITPVIVLAVVVMDSIATVIVILSILKR